MPAARQTQHLAMEFAALFMPTAPAVTLAPSIAAPDIFVPAAEDSVDRLAHRYRMLVLRDHRHKLGRDLLHAGHPDPWLLAWAVCISFGRSFRPWAHARIFALACYLGVDMEPEILKQLRHPFWFGRYRRSIFGLWRLLEILAQKSGQKPVSRIMFRWFYCCPPLGVLIFEKQLQAILHLAQDKRPVVAPVRTPSVQGQ
jgi:hypothetical protein